MEDKLSRRNHQYAAILTIIIQNSTIMPFRWQKCKYMCFYCRSVFVESAQLKEHTDSVHRKLKIKDIIRRSIRSRGRTKLDVSKLSCRSCETEFPNFQVYLSHLKDTHSLTFNKEVSQSFDCFQLDDDGMHCLECGQYFQYFGPLVTHTYKYHIRQFLCEICGQGFAGKRNVHNHVSKVHRIKICRHCDETFQTQYALTKHVENVHCTDKLQCPMCPEILRNTYLKNRHLALVHDYKSAQYVCEICSKIFTINTLYLQHKLRVHYKEKNFTCEVCGQKAFNMTGLRVHMACHDDARPFKCEICDKTFRRKWSLMKHKKTHRIDENVDNDLKSEDSE